MTDSGQLSPYFSQARCVQVSLLVRPESLKRRIPATVCWVRQ